MTSRAQRPAARPICYTVQEVMEILRVSRDTVSEYIRRGALKRLDIPGSRLVRIEAKSLEALLS